MQKGKPTLTLTHLHSPTHTHTHTNTLTLETHSRTQKHTHSHWHRSHTYQEPCRVEFPFGFAFMASATKSALISALMNSDEPKVNYLLIEVCLTPNPVLVCVSVRSFDTQTETREIERESFGKMTGRQMNPSGHKTHSQSQKSQQEKCASMKLYNV